MENTKARYSPAQIASLPARIEQHADGQGRTLRSAVLTFASLADMAAARDGTAAKGNGLHDNGDGQWCRNWWDAVSKSRRGIEGESMPAFRDLVARGEGDEKLARTIQGSVATITAGSSTIPTWEMAPAGSYPIVPAAIGGDPFSMRVRSETSSDSAPIRIYLPLICSSMVSRAEFAEVITDCAAAALMLSEQRTVELIGYACLDATNWQGEPIGAVFTTCPIAFSFGDYLQLALWCENSIGRTIVMGIVTAANTGFDGRWPWWTVSGDANGEYKTAQYRKHLGLTDEDVIIPPIYSTGDLEQVRKTMAKTLKASGITLEWSSSK